MVLMRMMLSGRRSSEIRIWFSWSYTDFLGTFEINEKQGVKERQTHTWTLSQLCVENSCGLDVTSVCCLPVLWVASLGSTRSPCCWSCHSGPWSSAGLSWRCCGDASAACFPFYWRRDKKSSSKYDRLYSDARTDSITRHNPVCVSPDVLSRCVPRRHMVLGLCLAELANSSGHPFSVDVPAAHLPWPWPAVIGLWLLNHKEAGRHEPKELQEDDADAHHEGAGIVSSHQTAKVHCWHFKCKSLGRQGSWELLAGKNKKPSRGSEE